MRKIAETAALIIVVALFAFALTALASQVPNEKGRLAGYDCPGFTGIIYADEEDSFPEGCDRIIDASAEEVQ